MARQVGHVLYQGTLGGVRHYRIKGREGWFASMKGGPSREMIMKGKNFERTRENISEFAGVSKAAASFRLGLGSLRRRFQDSTFNNRVTKAIFRLMRRDSASDRGRRKVEFSRHARLLAGLEWNSQLSLSSVLNAKRAVSFSPDGLSASLQLAPCAGRLFNAPKGATHARVVLLLHTAADFSYSADSRSFMCVSPQSSGKSAVVFSDYIDVRSSLPDGLSLKASLSNVDLTSAAAFISVGVEFYQLVGDYFYSLSSPGAMCTLAAFSPSLAPEFRSVSASEPLAEGLVLDKDSAFYGRVRFKKSSAPVYNKV